MRTRRPSFLVVVLAALAVAVPVATVVPAAAAGSADAGFATPEEAVLEYMAGVAGADVERILAATAIDEMAEGYRFDEFVDRLKAFMPLTMLAPSTPFYVDINRSRQADQVLRQVLMLAYGLLSGETMDGSPIVPVDAAWADDFAAKVDASGLAGIEVLGIRPLDPYYSQSERYLENAATQAATYGADELTERLAFLSFEGQTYGLGFTLLRYGDGWKVAWQSSALSGLDAMGTAEPMTIADFEDLTAGG